MSNEAWNEIAYKFFEAALAGGVSSGVLMTSIGDPADAPWDGSAAEASVIAILKGIYLNTDLVNP